jgi:hypothetical protein
MDQAERAAFGGCIFLRFQEGKIDSSHGLPSFAGHLTKVFDFRAAAGVQ